jgi:hypothetical protein
MDPAVAAQVREIADRIQKVQALFASSTFPGEKVACVEAIEQLNERLARIYRFQPRDEIKQPAAPSQDDPEDDWFDRWPPAASSGNETRTIGPNAVRVTICPSKSGGGWYFAIGRRGGPQFSGTFSTVREAKAAALREVQDDINGDWRNV